MITLTIQIEESKEGVGAQLKATMDKPSIEELQIAVALRQSFNAYMRSACEGHSHTHLEGPSKDFIKSSAKRYGIKPLL